MRHADLVSDLDPGPARPRVLVVEDDSQLRGMLTELFTSEGYEVETAADGQQGLHLGLTHTFDVIVLDRGLPAVEGLDLLGRWRSRGVLTPILILSALGLARDRVDGLDAGAEDYLAKPFDVDELLARARALRRRQVDTTDVLPVPGGRLDVAARTVRLGGSTLLSLSERECALLATLARRPRRVFGRQELMDAVFADAEDEGVVDTYVHYLRRKIGRSAIRTVRGLGYQLGEL